MAEIQHYDPSEHQSQTSEQEERQLGAAALSLASERHVRYPDLTIEIGTERFAENPVIETPLIAHTRRIVRIINETAADQLGENPDYHVREPHMSRITAYLAQTVTPKKGETRQRKEIVDHTSAVEAVRARLDQVNHPVQQVLAKAEIELKDTLTAFELKNLTLDVLKVTHWPELKAEYEKQVSARRISSI